MKHLLLLLLFSASLSGFSQDKIDTIHIGRLKLIFRNDTLYNQYFAGPMLKDNDPKPDTLRATLIVCYDRGSTFLHATQGYVVCELWNVTGYLDRKKRVIKAPWEVFSYKLKK